MMSFISPKIMLTAVVALAMTACRPKVNDFSEYRNLPAEGWPYDEPLVFAPHPVDSAAIGSLTVGLRHSNQFLYSNLWLEVTIGDSLHEIVDTVNIQVADRLGHWLGRGIGTDFQLSDTIWHDIAIHRPVNVAVRHIMRDDLLQGIEQLGVTFVEREK